MASIGAPVACFCPAIRVIGGKKNPRQVWQGMLEVEKSSGRKSEAVHFLDNFKFPGRGQQDTPVITSREGFTRVMLPLPGAVGTSYRAKAVKLFEEYFDHVNSNSSAIEVSATPVSDIA